jgi:hypothetical protein
MKNIFNPVMKINPGLFILVVLLISGCKKPDTLVDIPSQAHFTGITFDNYFITGVNVTKHIPIGLTNVSDKDRTVTFTVTSPTGAVVGTHYSIVGGNTKVIPAGKALDSITVAGVYSQYSSGRKDTLVFTIQDGEGVNASTYNATLSLFMRGPCSESETVLTELMGDYNNTNEDFAGSTYGPYTTTISSVTQLSPTTGTIVVENIYDFGWNPITFTLDWTDPLNTKVTLIQQSGIGDAGTLSSAYAGMDISVRPFAGQTGTFSYCQNRLTLKMQLGVTGLGFFPYLYTVVMAR